ncbi:MAG: hypothetical protein IPG96_01170 [Proteobacteria bacterium]|nr:hypothetical protein [Pseudomonadota bacterium]
MRYPRRQQPAWVAALNDSDPWRSPVTMVVSALLLLSWAATVIWVALHHEPWRDEVRALSLAIAPTHLWQLPAGLKNEGHPLTWFLLLRGAYALTGSYRVLLVVSTLIGALAVGLFYWRAPLPLWLKGLFCFGVLPLYDYAVMARNYGISMLLLFVFAALYRYRQRRWLAAALTLAALAHTNVHSMILTCALLGLWLLDDLPGRPPWAQSWRWLWPRLVVVGIVGLALLTAYLTVRPDDQTVVTRSTLPSTRQLWRAIANACLRPGAAFGAILPAWKLPAWLPVLPNLLLGLLWIGLLIRPRAALALVGGTVLLGTFFATIFYGAIRHQGLLFAFILAVYWIVRDAGPLPHGLPLRRTLHTLAVYGVLPLLFAHHLRMGYDAVERDLGGELSANASLGAFLRARPRLQQAIVLGEPDFRLESLPYWVPNAIYVPREDRFARTVSFTRRARTALSLGELLATAQRLCRTHHRPVLIALGHYPLEAQSPIALSYSYNKLWTSTPAEVAAFRRATRLLAEFLAALSDETYQLYELPC